MNKLAEIIKNSNKIVFFGGAGVSTESGIPDFRSADGVFNKAMGRTLHAEDMVSHSFYVNYPADFFDFYRNNLIYPDAKPNDCHKALAKLEDMGKLSAVITQNIDGLHQMAGNHHVCELHGSVHRNYCTKCGKFYDLDEFLKLGDIPHCTECGGVVKPDVVLYEEGLDQAVLADAVHEISTCDTLIVGGTSLVVYPAAGLINYFRGKNLILINLSKTSYDGAANLCIYEKIGKVFRETMLEICG